MSDTIEPPAPQMDTGSAPPAASGGRRRIVGGARFVVTFLLANAGMYAIFQGMQQIVLPSQIAALDAEGKVGAYGIMASIGAAAAAIGNPVFGALSDRTRSRFGRRTPWILISAIVALVLLAVHHSAARPAPPRLVASHPCLALGCTYDARTHARVGACV